MKCSTSKVLPQKHEAATAITTKWMKFRIKFFVLFTRIEYLDFFYKITYPQGFLYYI